MLIASRGKAKARKQKITFVLIAVGVLGAGFAMWRDRQEKAALQKKLDFVETWIHLDKTELGGLWNCVTQDTTPLDAYSKGEQIRGKVELAYATQPKNFANLLMEECLPKGQKAADLARDMLEVPGEFKEPLAAYTRAIVGLNAGIEDYAARLKKRGTRKGLGQLIQENGDAWHSNYKPTAEGIAFHNFLYCAIPGLDKKKSAQDILQSLANECYKGDAKAFMKRLQEQCAEGLETLDPTAKTPRSFKTTVKKFYEDNRRMMDAFADCEKRANKGSKEDDLTQFLHAASQLAKARADIAKAGRTLQDSL